MSHPTLKGNNLENMSKSESQKEWVKKNYAKVLKYNREWIRRNKDKVYPAQRKYIETVRKPSYLAKMEALREYKGNKCAYCGYKEETQILQFHHLRDKDFGISEKRNLPLAVLKKEADKCELLCPNCHAIATLNSWRKVL